MAGRRTLRRILCAIDFSSCSRTALRFAAALTRRHHAELTVLFVNDPMLGAWAAAAAYSVRRLVADTDTELRRTVKRSIDDLTLAPHLVTVMGQPVREIERAVRTRGVDLLVMGSHGLTGPRKWVLGSTTERVLRTTHVPVLVIPERPYHARNRAARHLAKWPGATALIPVDLAEDDVDLRPALSILRAFDAAPVLLHVLPPTRVPSWLNATTAKLDRARLAAAERALAHLARKVDGATYEVRSGEPVDEIVAAAQKRRAGLIVTTLKRSTSTFGPRRGVISYQILAAGATPVLAVPSR